MNGTRVLITGGAGMLGTAFSEHLLIEGCDVRSLAHADLDVTDATAIMREESFAPNWIIHTAGLTNADYCEEHPDECFQSHVEGTRNIVEFAKKTGAKFFYPQSFLIFDDNENLITEDTKPNPLSIYGRAKLEAEKIVQSELKNALIVRMGGFFGGYERDKNFVGKFAHILRKNIAEKKELIAVGDRVWQPTWIDELAANSALLLSRKKSGVYHMASHGEASFYDAATVMIDVCNLPLKATKISAAEFVEKCKRPMRAVLDNRRLREENLDRMSAWRDALTAYLQKPYFKKLFQL